MIDMNEEIKELARECGLPTDSRRTLSHEVERFAEDMVRKCSLYLWKNEPEWTAFKEDRLFKHFGVEE
jgi:hypothetical protein